MGKMKSLLLAPVLIAVLLSGCGGNNEGASPSPSANDSGASPSASTSPAASPANVEPLNLNFYYYSQALQINGDMPIFKEAAKTTGVTLKNVAPTGGDDAQAWNLLLASGELPDIVSYQLSGLNNIAVQGALAPLDDLLAENAPNFKAFLDENKAIKSAITASDGKIYVVPFVSDGEAQEGWFIRQDWLDKLGLETPATVQEYYEVLKAFREQDPNGNGKKDEVPFFSRNATSGFASLFPLWDASLSFKLKDGKIVYGPNEPEYKTALVETAKWYKEGLIDQEIFTRGNTARDILFANDTGGSVHDWFASTANFNDKMKPTIPDFSLRPIAPPASISGKVFEVTKRNPLGNNAGWAISANAKDPAAVLRYMDFWWTEEGRRLHNFGIEGETYTMVDGKPVFTEKVLNEPAVVDYLIKTTGAQLIIGGHQDFAYEEQWTNKIALEGVKMYVDNNYFAADYQVPQLNFTLDEDKQIKELFPPIETYVMETSQKWFMGGEPVEDNYDNFVQQLKQLKLDEVLEIYNTAYARYQEQQ